MTEQHTRGSLSTTPQDKGKQNKGKNQNNRGDITVLMAFQTLAEVAVIAEVVVVVVGAVVVVASIVS